ncbi:hypothetical protein PR202_gb13204 [Eleusine coracana subsp. coracana]|uniref:Uncharacterized protein n=1 Tax=Eleusine coracana subsp. coracana TaxID=191504 RepID=A0AAV5ERI9_ELECO|nr:hypothetical protein PR202_gb13204 [Eleusine coracana subsp. coracana]
MLVAWQLWKHRNRCVFDKITPNVQAVVQAVIDEGWLWIMVGAAKITPLGFPTNLVGSSIMQPAQIL